MKDLIDVQPAADYLGLSVQTLANWRWRGVGPRHFRVGGRIKYDRADLDAWLEANVVEPTPAA